MPQTAKLSKRFAIRVVATVFLAAAVIFGLAESAQAFPPPASWHGLLGQLMQSCEVHLVLSTSQTSYQPGETVQITARMTRIGGLWRRIQTHIPPAPAEQLDRGYIDPRTIGVIEEELSLPELTFRSLNQIRPGNSVTGIINYPIPNEAPAGSVTLTGTPSSLLADGSEEPDCTVRASTVNLTITTDNHFDFALTGSSVPTLIYPDDAVSILADVVNTASAQREVPANLAFEVTATIPEGLTFVAAEPPAQIRPAAAGREVYWTRSTGSDPIPIGASYPSSFLVTYDSDQIYRGNYLVRLCVNPTTQWGIDNEEPKDNNCADVSIKVASVKVTKTWDDGSTAIRDFAPSEIMTFKVGATNLSNKTVTITLRDILASDINCDPLAAANCPAWDETISWTELPPGVTENSTTHELAWNNPVSLRAGDSVDYALEARVLDQDALYDKLRPNKFQARCNEFQTTPANSDSIQPHIRLCWTYSIGTDLGVAKTFKLTDGSTSDSLTIKQGDIGTYKVDVTNNGSHPGFNVQLTDQQVNEVNHGANVPHLFQWVPSSITDQQTAINQNTHTLIGWSNNEIDVGGSATVEPQFAVRCDARAILNNLNQPNLNFIDNEASITAANDATPTNNRNTNRVRATIADGHYNLGVVSNANPVEVVPQDPSRRRTLVTVTASNNQDGRVDLAVPFVTVEAVIPTQFSVDLASIAPGGVVINRNGRQVVVWETIPSIGIDGSAAMSVALTVGAEQVAITPPPSLAITARSVSSGANCGVASLNLGIPIKGPEFTQVKSIIDSNASRQTTGSAGLGETVTFELRVTNISTAYNFGRDTLNEGMKINDILDPNLLYTVGPGNATCLLYSPPNAQNGTACTAEQQSAPTEESSSPQVLSWQFSRLPANTALALQFKVVVQPSMILSVCPQPLYNSSGVNPTTLKDLKNPAVVSNFNPVFLQVFADQCLDGNIYARNDGGVIIRSDQVIINPNSILSSKGSINCGSNASCNAAPWQVGNYATDSSFGLDFVKVVNRMFRNIQRIQSTADVFPVATINPGTFDLYSGQPAVNYPDGRVYKLTDNITINTGGPDDKVIFRGRGTIIVNGNLTISGEGSISYIDSSVDHAIGFIVLPTSATDGNIVIGSSVRQLVGAFYAPGSKTQNLNTAAPVTSGQLVFQNAGAVPLRPARGLFIARQFQFQPSAAVVLQYNPLLNTASGAPPGFTFAGSPSETEEGL